jgi:glycogen operon protein
MIGFRKEHDIVRKDTGCCSLGFPEIQVMEANDYCKVLRIIYAGRNRTNTRDDIVCLAINVFWEEQEFCLPPVNCGMGWYVAADTGNRYLPGSILEKEDKMPFLEDGRLRMVPRSVCVLVVK